VQTQPTLITIRKKDKPMFSSNKKKNKKSPYKNSVNDTQFPFSIRVTKSHSILEFSKCASKRVLLLHTRARISLEWSIKALMIH
jgi:hypothetical protein